jgi:peptide/nickel transport system substrate-binding protein
MGTTGGSGQDTLDAQQPLDIACLTRFPCLYESLVTWDENSNLKNLLATELEPNHNATVWTIRVRAGVEFHNGKTLSSDDVIYTLQRLISKKEAAIQASMFTALDPNGFKKIDANTCSVACKTPFSTFPEALAGYNGMMLPVGYDPHNPVGTGPFKYQSFTPAVESTFVRNPNYHQSGLPYVDTVTITDFASETSMINAFTSGQLNMINYLSAQGARILQANSHGTQLSYRPGASWNAFVMNHQSAPFTDARVRMAFRLFTDRSKMNDIVFGGHGQLGNDIFSIADPLYDHSIPQMQFDVEQAKSLLKQAGHQNLSVQLVVGDVGPGMSQMAQLLVQTASQAGVTITLRPTTVTEIYSKLGGWQFTVTNWNYFNLLPNYALTMVPGASTPETHFEDPQFTSLYMQALATTDASLQKELAAKLQQINFDQSGYMIPVFYPTISAYASNIKGVSYSTTGYAFNQTHLGDVWIS